MMWNPWHGCTKYSEGCLNCYVYRSDKKYGRSSCEVKKCADFYLPVKKGRNGQYKIPPGSMVYTCFTSDFFLDQADGWRTEAWEMIKRRPDCHFMFITKRIERFYDCIPHDWENGYKNVTIGCTCENVKRARQRLPIFINAPIYRKIIICEPLLEKIDLQEYLHADAVAGLVAGGESGDRARICDLDWILSLRAQCAAHNVPFYFKQTGARFRKNGRVYAIPREFQHSQAKKADLNYGCIDELFGGETRVNLDPSDKRCFSKKIKK